MFPAWIFLSLNSLFFTLRLSGGVTGSFPRPLKAEEERMYLERMTQGDLEARNILIEHNLRLVAHIMKKYYTPNGDQDDLISIGTIGLIKGISTFKPDKNVRLATYASRCIENEILMYFRSQRKLQGEVSLSDSIDGDGGWELPVPSGYRCGISRSYVSQRRYCKRSPESLVGQDFRALRVTGGSFAVIVSDENFRKISGYSSN